MSTEARMQPDSFERLRSALEDARLSHDVLADCVSKFSANGAEEDVFRHTATRCLNSGGAGAGHSIESSFSELYEAMGLKEKAELRRWWHEKIRCEAYRYEDLRARLSWRYLI